MIISYVKALYLHPDEKSHKPTRTIHPMKPVDKMYLVKDKGIENNKRHFGKMTRSKTNPVPSPRQFSIGELELLASHGELIGEPHLLTEDPGIFRANIISSKSKLDVKDVDEVKVGDSDDCLDEASIFVKYKGRRLRIGNVAVVELENPREPCWIMDEIYSGLERAMWNERQGMLGSILESGWIEMGDPIYLLDD